LDHGEEEEEKEDLVISGNGACVITRAVGPPNRSNAAAMARKK
jgi:hypothetical protein